MTNKEKIEYYRKSIDLLDETLISILTERMRASYQVYLAKNDEGIPSYSPERWKEVKESKKSKAEKAGLDKELVEEVWESIHKAAFRERGEEYPKLT